MAIEIIRHTIAIVTEMATDAYTGVPEADLFLLEAEFVSVAFVLALVLIAGSLVVLKTHVPFTNECVVTHSVQFPLMSNLYGVLQALQFVLHTSQFGSRQTHALFTTRFESEHV